MKGLKLLLLLFSSLILFSGCADEANKRARIGAKLVNIENPQDILYIDNLHSLPSRISVRTKDKDIILSQVNYYRDGNNNLYLITRMQETYYLVREIDEKTVINK